MGCLEDSVRELILDRYRSLAEFARTAGIPEHTLYSALNNGLSGATLTTVMPITKTLKLDLEAVSEGRLILAEKATTALVPLYGTIAAGTPIEPTLADGTFPIPAALADEYPNAFMLRVEGNSMNRTLPDGFYVLVDPRNTIEASGQMYAIAIGENAATVKRVVLHDFGLTLEPDSLDPTYRPILLHYADTDIEKVSVIGRVVWYCPPADWSARQ